MLPGEIDGEFGSSQANIARQRGEAGLQYAKTQSQLPTKSCFARRYFLFHANGRACGSSALAKGSGSGF